MIKLLFVVFAAFVLFASKEAQAVAPTTQLSIDPSI